MVLILRVALAFTLVYAAILGLVHPFDWINYFPSILRSLFPDSVLLNLFGLSEVLIGAWLVWGKRIFIPSVISSIYLFGSLVFNLDRFNDLFMNLPMLGVAVALTIFSYPRIIQDRV